MAKVYVVTAGSYSDYHIEAIFSKKSDALAFIASGNGGYDGFNEAEEWELDGSVGYVKRLQYRHELPEDRGWSFDTNAHPNQRTPKESSAVFRSCGKLTVRADSYISAEHAKKLAVERWQREQANLALDKGGQNV